MRAIKTTIHLYRHVVYARMQKHPRTLIHTHTFTPHITSNIQTNKTEHKTQMFCHGEVYSPHNPSC